MEMVDLSYSEHYREYLRHLWWPHGYRHNKEVQEKILNNLVRDLFGFDEYLDQYFLSLAV
jgi:hypothetical protein